MKILVIFVCNNEAKILIFGVVGFLFAGVADFMTWHGVVLVAHAIYQHGVSAITSPKSVFAAVRSVTK